MNIVQMVIRDVTERGIKKKSVKLKGIKNHIDIEIRIFKNSGGMLHFFLIDPRGILRIQYLGNENRKKLLLGSEGGSIGTYPGDFPSGEWKIYTVGLSDKEEYSRIEYEIKIENDGKVYSENYTLMGRKWWVNYIEEKDLLTLNFDSEAIISGERRWYRGDLHTHTTLSDGHMSPEEAKIFCESNDMEFMYLTEHNLVHTGFAESNVLFIPGIEVTAIKGHLILYGLKHFPNFFNCKDFHKVFIYDILNNKRKEGYLTNIAHPSMKPWDWRFGDTDINSIDLIEICNCPTWPPAEKDNNNAIKLLDLLWNEGYRIYGVGGSDNHLKPDEKYEGAERPSLYGDPSTWVFCNGLCEAEILRALKAGRVYVSRGVKLDINILGSRNDYLPGERIEEEQFEIYLSALNGTQTLNVILIKDGKIKEKKVLKDRNETNFRVKWEGNGFEWVRLEIRNLRNEFVSYINPVYRGDKKPSFHRWKELCKVV